MNPTPSQARSGKEKMPERLSYCPRIASICDEAGRPLLINACPDSIDGLEAELVRRWNAHEQMRKALASADDALDQIRNAQGNTLNPHHLSQIAYAAHNEVKAALAAGGNVLCS